MKKRHFKKLALKKKTIYQILGGVTDPNEDNDFRKEYMTCRSPCQGGTGSCQVP
ncbi:hypothetical protein [Kordia jejudonensis]|uniref:hypothetical protein n=1 Tax=Kordia jejudonensis TaxID=1348245 RepID=UPI0012E01AAD|nr:hypothetical protein [Kordia jejudonensis]